MQHRVPQPCRAYRTHLRIRTFAPWGIFCTCVPHAYRPQPHRTYVCTACDTPGGSKDAAEELLVEVLAELKTMETADWGLMDTREMQPAAGDTKYYSGL